MTDCIFCKILNKEIPSFKVFEDEYVYAFKDINPQAKMHIVIIPKSHYTNLIDAYEKDSSIFEKLMNATCKIAKDLHLDKSGFRIVNNCGKDGCQSVEHIHFHLLGGGQLSEKMA